jgi:hypothetical protein
MTQCLNLKIPLLWKKAPAFNRGGFPHKPHEPSEPPQTDHPPAHKSGLTRLLPKEGNFEIVTVIPVTNCYVCYAVTRLERQATCLPCRVSAASLIDESNRGGFGYRLRQTGCLPLQSLIPDKNLREVILPVRRHGQADCGFGPVGVEEVFLMTR